MTNAHTFRAYAKLEDKMMRAAMPRTDARDPKRFDRPATVPSRYVIAKPLTFTIAEVLK